MSTPTWTSDDIADDGERVSHLRQDANFFGHLSIYEYAAPLARDARILDVGCGAGYGSAYLAEHGARSVLGIDPSANAIRFSEAHFQRANLEYRQMSAEAVGNLPAASFDFIFTSNVLEHVPEVGGFLAAAPRLLARGGRMLVAVPPITNDYLLYLNVVNPYHLNLWSPRQWQAALSAQFERCEAVRHAVTNPEVTVADRRFVVVSGSVDEMYESPTLTAVFVASEPRAERDRPGADAPMVFVDDSFSRSPGEISDALRIRLQGYFPTWLDRVRMRGRQAGDVSRSQGALPLFAGGLRLLRRTFRRRA